MRAVLRISVDKIADEALIELKRKVEKLIEGVPTAELEISMMPERG